MIKRMLAVAALCLVGGALFLLFRNTDRGVNIDCFSSFNKYSRSEPQWNVVGFYNLKLNENNKGVFYINAANSNAPHAIVKRTYYFNYKINSRGMLTTGSAEISKTPVDNVDDITFTKYFQNFYIKSVGNLYIKKFKNIYLIETSEFVVHTCTPS